MFFFGGVDFFSAKRLFFRVARDVSGVRSNPLWTRVVIKLKTSFQALSHSSSHERAKALTSPPPDFLFSSIPPKPPSKATISPNRDERGKPAIGDGVSCLTPCKRGRSRAQLGDSASRTDEPRRGSVVANYLCWLSGQYLIPTRWLRVASTRYRSTRGSPPSPY